MPRASTTEEVKRVLALGLTPGDVITLEALEEVLSPVTRKDRRFDTIVRAVVRYALKWHNCLIERKPHIGLYVLHEHERATEVVTRIGRTVSPLKEAKDRADKIPIAKLDGLHLDEANHVRRAAHWFYDTVCEEVQKLATRPRMPEPTPPLPQRMGIRPGETGMVSKAS